MLRFLLSDGRKGRTAKVTNRGQLIVSPIAFSEFFNVTADLINTGYTVVPPKSGHEFVITSIFLYANKNVGASDATVELYETKTEGSLTASKSILKTELPKNDKIVLTALNNLVSEGVWLSVKTDDDDIFVNVGGYYVEVAQ
jgi:hypothetical protein